MKSTLQMRSTLIKVILAQVFLAVTVFSARAQINSSDPSLVLWLQASNITSSDVYGAGIAGPYVTNWTDSSSYGTMLAPPPLPPGDTGTETNRTPQLITVTNNGRVFQAVDFLQSNDPLTGGTNNYADRLWQTNNQGANDPLEIYTTNDITLFVVDKNNAPNGSLGPEQVILAKRGPLACPYEFELNAGTPAATAGTAPNNCFVDYAGDNAYSPAPTVPAQPEWGLIEMHLTATGVLTFNEYYPSLGGWRTSTMTSVPRSQAVPGDAPLEMSFHTQGAGGTASNPWGNGTYARWAGDISEAILYNRSLTSNETQNVEDYLLTKYFLNPGPPQITTQPKSLTVNEFGAASFNVLPDGTPPFTYQWLKGGTPIPGANASRYTIPSVVTNDAANYSVIVSNSVSYITSQAATLTVIPDTNAPTVTSAILDYTNHASVTVTFSELVDPASATNIANYSLNNSASVTAALAIPQVTNTLWSNYITTVVLTTTPLTSQSTLTVNGVNNRAGIPSTNAEAVILVPGTVSAPPTANLVMWLKADAGVLADNTGVYQWTDQSGTANDHTALYSFGNPQLGQMAFPNAIHPIVSFAGAGLAVDNPTDFNAQHISIYLVGDIDNTKTADDFIGNWEGWVLGGSDGYPGQLKWSTWATNSTSGYYAPIDPTSVKLGNRVPTMITATFSYPGSQNIYFNNTEVGTRSPTVPIDYITSGVEIGALNAAGAQPVFGDIAEMLVYTNVSAAQNAAVEQYLADKYFTPSATLPTIVSATRSTSTNVTIVFSEPISEATATNIANYAINYGVTVDAATIVNPAVANSAISPTTVELTTSQLNAGYNYMATVNGISDWAGNAIAPNSQIAITGIPAPTISIAPQGTSISVNWNASTNYVLQSAPSVTGPWSVVTSGGTNAGSPYVVTPQGATEFYRLSQ